MSTNKRCLLVLSVVLLVIVFAGYVYYNNSRPREEMLLLNPKTSHSLTALVEEPSYGVNVEPGQGFILTDEYDGQQGAGLESLVSLQVSP